MSRAKAGGRKDPATEAFEAGELLVRKHPLIGKLFYHVHTERGAVSNPCPRDGWAVATSEQRIYVHPTRRASPEEWSYVLAHCLLHFGFKHFQERRVRPDLWNVACDVFVGRFLRDLKFGRCPAGMAVPEHVAFHTEEQLYDALLDQRLFLPLAGTAGPGEVDLIWSGPMNPRFDWDEVLAGGLRAAVEDAIEIASGVRQKTTRVRPELEQSRKWFVNSYPLLGALAAAFELVDDRDTCKSMDISTAAVDAEERRIYFNPLARLEPEEMRFVMAHEMLHVGLAHSARCQGRDPFLWNVACDYVINGWLVEMDVGAMPQGLLYDPELKGLSAEAIYDIIVRDLRRYRKVATLRGIGACDMLPPKKVGWWLSDEGVALDDFYRSCLTQGLRYWQSQWGRGFLPAGLIQEIEALNQPPIGWDVELAQWFDHHFAPREQRRTFARPSRRQASTPDIPRPRYCRDAPDVLRTFAVVLDTSGSMPRELLGKALGAISSYSVARDVDLVRLVFCDAAAYDQGYVRPEEIAHRVKIRGRGGTVLQPGIDVLEKDPGFPPSGPVLIITDGECDVLRVPREHAYLMPASASLPFSTRAPVFRIR